MITALKRLSRNNVYFKAIEWTKLVAIVGSAQVIIQLIALINGIIIIHALSIEEYAIYTLANTALGTLTILSDGGISAGVLGQGSKVWRNRERLGEVVITGLDLRRRFASIALVIFVPIMSFLLLQHGASYFAIALIILSIIPSFYASLSDSLLQIAPKLSQDIKPLQKNTIAVNIGRLVLVASTIFLFPWAFVAILSAGIPRILANIKLKKIAAKYVDWEQKSNPIAKERILKTVKRLLPEQVYFCVSSQITIWLISIFGSTQAIAQVGVLSRLAMLLTIFTMVLQVLVVPRFARLPSSKKGLIKWFIRIQGILFLFVLLVISASNFFTTELLLIMGSKYSGLGPYFVLAVISAMLNSVTGVLYSLMISRNFIMHPAISISIGVMVQVLLINILDFSTLEGVYYFSIFQALLSIVTANLYFFYRIRIQRD